jgi:hypothetical protein
MKEDLTKVHSRKRRPRKDGKGHGYFEEVIFSVKDWQAMRDILDILTVSFMSFLFHLHCVSLCSPLIPSLPQPIKMLTREMEGNKPTGCMVLVKYVQLLTSMEERLRKMHKNDPLYPMVDVMKSKIKTYLDESLDCDTIVPATIFHPGLRLKFFSHAFPTSSRHRD